MPAPSSSKTNLVYDPAHMEICSTSLPSVRSSTRSSFSLESRPEDVKMATLQNDEVPGVVIPERL